ncbi:YolD-like family protein [Paenibacillus sp. 1P03SA]|uniref:YolD-like family protein n=1 Tax=Paenibacillus sp. 1P03SA TaxID=3132294 RepID=UPI0039A1836E
MGKKLEGNGLYESSRMILPEHKEAIQRQLRDLNRRTKPILDEQAWEMMLLEIVDARSAGKEITLVIFEPFEDKELRGKVTKFDMQLRRVRLDYDDDWDWIKWDDIVSVYT